jgi:hypothetical protein
MNRGVRHGRRILMALMLKGETMALYLDGEIICPSCATDGEMVADSFDENLMFEELEGYVDELWCDRCGVRIFCAGSQCADRASDMYDLLPRVSG